MKYLIILTLILFSTTVDNPNLDQDVIFLKAAEVKLGEGETCEVINKKDMLKSKKILQKYWGKNLSDTSWSNYNRQYMIYNSVHLGTVVYINGACLEKPASYFEDVWCLGMASSNCYYDAFINLKRKKVIHFNFRTY